MQSLGTIVTELGHLSNLVALILSPVAIAFTVTGGTYFVVSKMRNAFFEATLRHHWLGKPMLCFVYATWITLTLWALDASTRLPHDPKGVWQAVGLFFYQLPALGAFCALVTVIFWECRRADGAFSRKT